MNTSLTRSFGLMALLLSVPCALAQSGTWNVDAGGGWSTAGNWLGNTIANGADNTANFAFGLTADRTVLHDTVSRAIGHMIFEDTLGANNLFLIGNTNTLTLSTTVGTPTITATGAGGQINPVLAGTQGFVRLGDGTLYIGSPGGPNNTYTGDTHINAGVTVYNKPGAFNTNALGGTVFINSGATLVLPTVAPAHNLSRALTLSGGTLRVDFSQNFANGAILTIASTSSLVNNINGGTGVGQAFTTQQTLSGSGDLEITVNGLATSAVGLWGDNTLGTPYSGTIVAKSSVGTTVFREMQGGVIKSIGSGDVLVESGGKFGYDAGAIGAGTDVGAINWAATHNIGGSGNVRVEAGSTTAFTLTYQGATITPGVSGNPGVLTFDGRLVLDQNNANVNSTLAIALDGVSPGTGYSRLAVNGSLLSLASVDLAATIGYGYAFTDKAFIVVNDGADAIVGTFAGLADGDTVNLGMFGINPAIARISYFGDSASNSITGGNDVVLYDFKLPEPASAAVLAGLGLIVTTRRRVIADL